MYAKNGIKVKNATTKESMHLPGYGIMNEQDEEVITLTKPAPVKNMAKDGDDEEDDIETEAIEDDIDDSEVKADEDDWDPDFDEFDLPKSTKKTVGGKKGKDEDDEDFKIDEDFKDIYNGSSSGFGNNDDDY